MDIIEIIGRSSSHYTRMARASKQVWFATHADVARYAAAQGQ